VHHDVEPAFAEILAQAVGHAVDREIALILVALVLTDLLRHLGHRIEGRVERIDPFELQSASVG
jgi:hypothetical protein